MFAPYDADPTKWERLPWTDRSSGQRFRISTTAQTGGAGVARVTTYRDVLAEFRTHPEAKSAGADGRPCDRQTIGLLRRRRVPLLPELLSYVGKESNRLEEVEAGLGHDPDEVWTEYADPGRDPWTALVLPVLRQMPAKELAAAAGVSERSVKAIRNGRASPRPAHQGALIRAAATFARDCLRTLGVEPPVDDLATCVAYLASRATELDAGIGQASARFRPPPPGNCWSRAPREQQPEIAPWVADERRPRLPVDQDAEK